MKNFLKTFNSVLTEAADFYDVPKCDVSVHRFFSILGGRMKQRDVTNIGYARLKAAVAPKPNKTAANKSEISKLIAKLVKNA